MDGFFIISCFCVGFYASFGDVGGGTVYAESDPDSISSSDVDSEAVYDDDSIQSERENENSELQENLQQNNELQQRIEKIEKDLSGEGIKAVEGKPLYTDDELKIIEPLLISEPSFSTFAIGGSYNPDNWSSGYRVYSADSQDQRWNAFNDFAYWSVRKQEIKWDALDDTDDRILDLLKDTTSEIATVRSTANSAKSSANSAQSTANTALSRVNTLAAEVNSISSDIAQALINRFSEYFGTANYSSSLTDGDGKFTKLIKYQNNRIMETIDKVTSATNGFKDSLNNNIINRFGEYFALKDYNNSPVDGDGIFVKFIKNQNNRLNDSIENVRTSLGDNILNRFNEYFNAKTYTSALTDGDGIFVKFIKYQNNMIITEIKDVPTSIEKMRTSIGDNLINRFNEYFGLGAYGSELVNGDGVFVKFIKNQNNMIKDTIDSVSSRITLLNANQLLNTTAVNSSSKKNSEDLTLINASLKSLKNYDDTSLKTYIDGRFMAYFTVYGSFEDGNLHSKDGVFTRLLKGQFNRIVNELVKLFSDQNLKLNNLITVFNVGNVTDVVSTNDSTFVAMLKNQFKYLASFIKDYTNLLTSMNANQLLTTAAINGSSNKNSEDLTLINASLKSLKNYDDLSFKEYIKFRFDNYFSTYFGSSANYESGISSNDGIFTKILKGQLTRLIAELNRQFTLSLTATTNNIDSFKEYLREEFGLLNDWLSLIVEWLKQIYEKPTAVFENIPFNYDLLQQMLDGISFGNVVNEAGTNLWDVLKELIDALGGVLESIMNIVPDLIDKLIGLVIPDNRNIFSEKMSQFTSKFKTKFSSITSVTTEFKNVYNQPKNISSIQINLFDQKLQLIPDIFVANFNWLRGMLSAYLYLSTLVTCYKRIVGSGDVIE